MKRLLSFCLLVALLLAAGCKPKAKDIPPLLRKEAANLVSEAQFASSLRDYARAEPLLAKAADLCSDNGDYWVSLGVARRRLGNASGAKTAYQQGLAAYRDAYALTEGKDGAAEILLQQIYVQMLLGKPDDARSTLEKAQKTHPDNRNVRGFAETKQLERIPTDPAFKDIAL